MCLSNCVRSDQKCSEEEWRDLFRVQSIPAFREEESTGARPNTYLVAKYTRSLRDTLHLSPHVSGYIYASGIGRSKLGIHVFPADAEAPFSKREELHRLLLAATDMDMLLCSLSSGHVVAHNYQVLGCETCTSVFIQRQAERIQTRMEALAQLYMARAVLSIEAQLEQRLQSVEQQMESAGYRWLVGVVADALHSRGIPASTLLTVLMAEADFAGDTVKPGIPMLPDKGRRG